MTEPRHAAPTRPRPRVVDFISVILIAFLLVGVGFLLGEGKGNGVPAPATLGTPSPTPLALRLGGPVRAGDGRLYYYRGWHQEERYGHAHPLVSDTPTSTPKIAPGLTVTPVG